MPQIFPEQSPLDIAWEEYARLMRGILEQPELLVDREHFTKCYHARLAVERLLNDD